MLDVEAKFAKRMFLPRRDSGTEIPYLRVFYDVRPNLVFTTNGPGVVTDALWAAGTWAQEDQKHKRKNKMRLRYVYWGTDDMEGEEYDE